jgi:hypothetical protein
VQPTNGNDQYDAIQLGLAGVDLGMRPKYWRPWDEEGRREALAVAKPLKPLLDRTPHHTTELDRALAKAGRPVSSMVYVPLLARQTDWVVLLDPGSGAIVGFAPLDGF